VDADPRRGPRLAHRTAMILLQLRGIRPQILDSSRPWAWNRDAIKWCHRSVI
jgi:hypothetical protein